MYMMWIEEIDAVWLARTRNYAIRDTLLSVVEPIELDGMTVMDENWC